MALQHGRTLPVQLRLERRQNIRVIVSDIVNAISGQEVQNSPAIAGKKLRSGASFVADIHLQNIEQPDPLRIDVAGIGRADSGRSDSHLLNLTRWT